MVDVQVEDAEVVVIHGGGVNDGVVYPEHAGKQPPYVCPLEFEIDQLHARDKRADVTYQLLIWIGVIDGCKSADGDENQPVESDISRVFNHNRCFVRSTAKRLSASRAWSTRHVFLMMLCLIREAILRSTSYAWSESLSIEMRFKNSNICL
nr:hypothetical protein CFP56_10501 [Quercus suber]